MRNVANGRTGRLNIALGKPAWAAALCLAWAASCALAQSSPPTAEPKAETPKAESPKVEPAKAEAEAEQTKLKVSEAKKASAQPQANPAKRAANKGGCGASKKRSGSSKLGQDPNARWACDQSTITLEPVWHGAPLTFTFEIRNEGTADLHIRARGG